MHLTNYMKTKKLSQIPFYTLGIRDTILISLKPR